MIEPCVCTWDTIYGRKSKQSWYVSQQRGEDMWSLVPLTMMPDLGWMYPIFCNMLCTISIYKKTGIIHINDVVHCHDRVPRAFSDRALRLWWVTRLCFMILLQSSFSRNEIQEARVSVWGRDVPEQQRLSPWHLKKAVVIVALGSVLAFIRHLNFWLRSCRMPCRLCTT